MPPIAQSIATQAAVAAPVAQRGCDVPTPRYTAYPSVDRLVEAFGPDDLRYALWQRANGAVVGGCAPLAVRVGVPAACRSSRLGSYLHALGSEISLVASALGSARTVSRLNLGGPALLRLSHFELARLVELLHASFRLELGLPMGAEVDTGTLVEGRLPQLRQLGCTELLVDLSEPAPGAARDGAATVARLVGAAHRLGFTAVGVRVPFGAPLPTPEGLRALLQRLVSARPDRLALQAFGAASASGRRAMGAPEAASAAQRGALFEDAIGVLDAAGYVHVGLEQFALRSDVLAVARAQGRLFVDLDGLNDLPCADLIALGAGMVGQVGATYYQNAVAVADYEAALAAGQLPVARGLALARDDLARRSVIQALVCQGRVDFESIRLAHLIDPKVAFALELDEISRLARAGLVSMDAEAIELTPAGCRQASAVAAVFDRYLRAQARRNQCAALL